MTALRELAELWRRLGGFTYEKCADELLVILDAEGDGGAVAEAAAYGLAFPDDVKRGRVNQYCIFGTREEAEVYSSLCIYKPLVVPFYTHPARSGVVSDEDVEAAFSAYWRTFNFVGEWSEESKARELKAMRAALEHFAKGSDEDVRDAERYRWLRKRVGVSASYGFTNAYIPCGNSRITEADAASTDQAIDAAIQG